MKWKEFLKIDRRKIVIFILFFVFSYLLGLFFLDGLASFESHPLYLIFIFLIYFLTLPGIGIGGLYENIILELLRGLINFIIRIIYWYFLSCLIVWIYDKVKKK